MGSLACAHQGCSATFCFTEEVEARLRRTHESFVCLFGHPQHFSAKTEQEKRIEELERFLRNAKDHRDQWEERYYAAVAALSSCPFSECVWRSRAAPERVHASLQRHFQRAHGERLRVVSAKSA